MKIFDRSLVDQPARQGDIMISAIDALPEDADLSGSGAECLDGHWVVTHSETGHHHVMAMEKATLYPSKSNPRICYLSVREDAALVHLRSYDTHETILHPPGVYEIYRQREFSPQGWRRAID